jgi:hypothetical protein
MGRLNALVNLIILAIAAFIIWREITQPRQAPATARPRPAPAPPSTSRPAPAPAAAPESGPAAGPAGGPEADTGITGVVSNVAGMAGATVADDSMAAPPAGEPATVSGATEPAAGEAAGVGETVAPVPAAGNDAAATGLATAAGKAPPAMPPVPAEAVRGDGTNVCPDDHPIKGNAASMIFHAPGRASYDRTIAEFCFASVEAAERAGYRAPKH